MTKRDDRGHVDFSPPEMSDYQDRIRAAKEGHIPVGGAEMPKRIPPLDQPAQRSRHEGVQSGGGTKPMTSEEYNRAIASGAAIPGVGSAYQVNQPRGFTPPKQDQSPPMAVSGVGGAPVNPPRAEGGLRPETQEALKAVADANTTKEEDSTFTKEDESYIRKLAEETESILTNKGRRDYIESRIEDELSFDDLLFQQEIRQRVPIRKNFVPTFRTPSAAEDLFVKRLMSKEDGSAQYIMDKFASMGLVCGLFALNGKTLPDHCDEKRVPKEDLFNIKYELISKYPIILIADLSANFVWFEERVRKLMSLDAIKGF